MRNKLTSRKLWIALLAIITSLVAGLAGEQPWSQVTWQVGGIALAYLGVEGFVDAMAAQPPSTE